jgi:hypothetical protein
MKLVDDNLYREDDVSFNSTALCLLASHFFHFQNEMLVFAIAQRWKDKMSPL